MTEVTFYFDVGSPYAYLAAERVEAVIGQPVRWQPVLLGALFKLSGRSSWARGDERRRRAGMREIERRAREYGLPPIRWPDPWPTDYLFAMRAMQFAFEQGAGERMAREALRAAFQRGVDLNVPEGVLAVAEDVGLDPAAVQAATQDPSIKLAVREDADAAYELGVFGVPTVAVGTELFWGEDRLQDAAAFLRGQLAR